ncbi:MAG: helix-turn-helix domain-containing protein [Pseudomonadota bacterium]
MSETQLLVTDKEAAAMLRMGKSTFWREVRAGRLPASVKMAGNTRWRVSDLRQAVEPATSPTTPLTPGA